jgi:hypothetical protein
MKAIAKALVLPLLFVLPIFLLRLSNDLSIREILAFQPLLLLLLIPGLIIIIQKIIKGLWGQMPYPKS